MKKHTNGRHQAASKARHLKTGAKQRVERVRKIAQAGGTDNLSTKQRKLLARAERNK